MCALRKASVYEGLYVNGSVQVSSKTCPFSMKMFFFPIFKWQDT
jgi:hypothetical protein